MARLMGEIRGGLLELEERSEARWFRTAVPRDKSLVQMSWKRPWLTAQPCLKINKEAFLETEEDTHQNLPSPFLTFLSLFIENKRSIYLKSFPKQPKRWGKLWMLTTETLGTPT